jgi:hypothetical protein
MRVMDNLDTASSRASILRCAELYHQSDRIGIVRWHGNQREVIDLFPITSEKIIDVSEFAQLETNSNSDDSPSLPPPPPIAF